MTKQSGVLFVGSRCHSEPQHASSIHRTAAAWSVFLAWKPLLLCRTAPWKLRAKLLRMTATCSGSWQHASYPLPLVNVRRLSIQRYEWQLRCYALARCRQSLGVPTSSAGRARDVLNGFKPSLAALLTGQHRQATGHLFLHPSEAK